MIDPSSDEEPAVDSTAELAARLRRGRFGNWSRRRVAVVAAIGGALVLTGCLWKGAPWLVEHAKDVHVDCSNSNYHEVPGTALECEGDFAKWLLVPKLVPWTRREAREKELDWTADEIDTRLALATEVYVDAEMRERAAEELASWMTQPGFSSDRRTTDWAFAMIAAAGFREATVRHAALAKGGFDRQRAMRAALAIGDIDAATQLAKIDEPDQHGYEYHRQRGAWLCLMGDAAAGRAALETAKASYRSAVSYPYPDAQMAALACGAAPGSEENSTYREALWAADVLSHPRPSVSITRLDPNASFENRAREVTSPFFADWLAAQERDPAETVAWSGLLKLQIARGTTPWNLSSANAGGMFSTIPMMMDPVRHARAAERLEALLAAMERQEVRIEPIDDDDPDARRWGYDNNVRAARREPAPVLRTATTFLWFEIASMAAITFDEKGLRRAIARIPEDEQRGAAALILATYLFRVGERAAARKMLKRAVEGQTGRAAVDAELFGAMLELAEARPEQALAAVRRARKLVPAAEQELRAHPLASSLGTEVQASMHRAIGWVEAAAALAAGETRVEEAVSTPTYFEGPDLPVDWFSLARAPADVRRNARFRMHDPDIDSGEQAVLPAVLYVMHEVARDGTDPDVFVDRVLPLHADKLNGPTAQRARAEAARMRGDAAAARLWDERAAKLEALFSEPKRALLARLSGLE